MKASDVIEEIFVSDNCGKNFKTTQGLKDQCDQSHQNLPNWHKYQKHK